MAWPSNAPYKASDKQWQDWQRRFADSDAAAGAVLENIH